MLPTISSAFIQSPMLFVSFCMLIGLIIGSFLNVVIYRLPKMMELAWQESCREPSQQSTSPHATYNLFQPKSACPHCQHAIGFLENIPVLSYVFLGGRCHHCKQPISIRYPMIEVASGLLVGLIAWHFGYSIDMLSTSVFVLALLTLTCIDLETQLLPDIITLPLLWAGLIFNFNTGFTGLQSAVIGAIAGYLILWTVYWTFKLITKKEGMGHGDFKMLAAIGAWLGWQMIPAVILLSSLSASIVGLSLIIFDEKKRSHAIPFGPYLALAGMIALFWHQSLTALFTGN